MRWRRTPGPVAAPSPSEGALSGGKSVRWGCVRVMVHGNHCLGPASVNKSCGHGARGSHAKYLADVPRRLWASGPLCMRRGHAV